MVTEVIQPGFEDLFKNMEPIRVKDGRCHNDMIFVEYGNGYAIADNGATVCLGPMPEVELYLRHGIDKGFHPIVIQILDGIKNMEAKIGRSESVNTINAKLRTPDIKQRNNKRVRLSGNTRNNSKHFKPVKVAAKLSLHTVRSE